MRLGSLVLAVSAALMPATLFAAPVVGKSSFSGYDQAVGSASVVNATGLNFADASGSAVVGTSGALNGYGANTGSFAVLGACSSFAPGCGTIKDVTSFTSSPPISNFVSFISAGSTVTFDLTSITSINRVAANSALFLIGTGVIYFSGYDPTPGTFTLNTQGSNVVSFSGSITANAVTSPAVPEPATWAMMIAGFGMVGFAMRRRQTVAILYVA